MIVGVDISSHRIDLAWLDEQGRPQRWHQQLDPKAHLIDRLRSIRTQWPSVKGTDVDDIAIEYPFGRSRAGVAALSAVLGVVTRQAPPWARVAWPSSGELRAAIGARNTKESAHKHVIHAFRGMAYDSLLPWDEHSLDALVACLGWTEILRQQDAA